MSLLDDILAALSPAYALVRAAAAELGVQFDAGELMKAGTKVAAAGIKGGVTSILGADVASNIDDSGDPFALIGSLQDIVTDERRLTAGPLSFQDVLRYENRLSGIQVVVVLASFAFSLIVETVTLGQVEGFVGLLLHLIDDTVGQYARVVSTQLVRRAVAEPYEIGYRRIHRLEDLSVSDAEAAFADGAISEERLVDVLVGRGVRDDAIQTKVTLARVRAFNQAGVFPIRTKFVSTGTLTAAFRAGVLSDDEFLHELARQGYDDTALAVFWGLANLKNPPAGGGG